MPNAKTVLDPPLLIVSYVLLTPSSISMDPVLAYPFGQDLHAIYGAVPVRVNVEIALDHSPLIVLSVSIMHTVISQVLVYVCKDGQENTVN